jgi:Rod binding domain-containing protein
MSSIDKAGASQPLTPEQQQALQKLHEAATQFEGVFMQMVMSAMQDTVPKDSIFGQESDAEQTWSEMLNNERAQAIAKQGGLGIGKALEAQLRSQVLADAKQEAHVQVEGRMDP